MESCENLLLNSSSQHSGVWRAVEGKFLLLQTLCFLFSRKIDLPEEMGSLNILNIKYIIQEKPQTNPSEYKCWCTGRWGFSWVTGTFPVSLERSHSRCSQFWNPDSDAIAQTSSPQISLLNVSCRFWPGLATPQWLFSHLFREGRIQQAVCFYVCVNINWV